MSAKMFVPGECERELLHTRQITCSAYRRNDGYWEIEAAVSDLKSEEVAFRSRESVKPGEFIHSMTICFLIDESDTVQEVCARMVTGPWRECAEVENSYSRLRGLRIGPGFQRHVRERIGRGQGCSHITDLITQVGNTYLQASWPLRVVRQTAIDANPQNWLDPLAVGFVGECYAWRRDGEALHAEFPELTDTRHSSANHTDYPSEKDSAM